MTEELYWLTLTTLMTGLFWMPYIINRFIELGIVTAILNPNADPSPKAIWAGRMMKAHNNAVENLVIFAPLVLAVHLTNTSSAATEMAVIIYFFTRLVHYFVYTLGVPGLRTVAFLIGFACQMTLGLTVLSIL